MARNAENSTETILTFKRNDDFDNMSDWSVVWSTHHVPGMDRATGAGSSRRRKTGRRRLRLAALTVGGFLTMHVQVAASALTGGYFIFILLLIITVAALANPLRHFEVYLGQWSISGPGRAFRIIPMFDGIGVAICIHAILRAIICVVLAALSALFVVDSISDKTLPFTYCRDMDLKAYESKVYFIDELEPHKMHIDVGGPHSPWRRAESAKSNDLSRREVNQKYDNTIQFQNLDTSHKIPAVRRQTALCNETFPSNYPPIFKAPAYNYFYVEVIHYRSDHNLTQINTRLLIAIMAVWGIIWLFVIVEKIIHGRMIWNNMVSWFVIVPWCWAALLIFTGVKKFLSREQPLRNNFELGGHKDVLDFTTNVFVVSTYIHAAALGCEIIHGKGLNHYASGHIDPHLNGENLWHSGILLILTALCSGGVSVCAHTDYMQMRGVSQHQESTLWVFPLIAKCSLSADHMHFTSSLLFAGLLLSYVTIAFVCMKTALHIIFEYRVKLVFVEQLVVAALMIFCMAVSVIFTTNASLGILEGLDVFLAGIATPLISAMEMFGLLYVYRSHDFMSDMNIATEDNACSSRVGIQWQILPFVEIILMILEAILISSSELPGVFLAVGLVAVLIIALALPLRACHNAYHFLQPPKPR